MGLDMVEFAMGVEEAFALRIPDDVAGTLATPRILIDYLHGQLPQSRESRCLSQRAFYAIRAELGARVGHSRALLRPGTEVLAVLPSRNAYTVWAEVGKSLGYPQWQHPRGSGWLARLFLNHRPRTLGAAAVQVATFTPGVLKPTGEGWSWHEVAKVIDGLMRYHFAIRDYSLDDHFFRDLGLD